MCKGQDLFSGPIVTDHMRLNLSSGRALRDLGMERAANKRQDLLAEWREQAVFICEAVGVCTTDDLRRHFGAKAMGINKQNWMGSIFRDSRFEWTGRMQPSRIPGNHARMIKVWRLVTPLDANAYSQKEEE